MILFHRCFSILLQKSREIYLQRGGLHRLQINFRIDYFCYETFFCVCVDYFCSQLTLDRTCDALLFPLWRVPMCAIQKRNINSCLKNVNFIQSFCLSVLGKCYSAFYFISTIKIFYRYFVALKYFFPTLFLLSKCIILFL